MIKSGNKKWKYTNKCCCCWHYNRNIGVKAFFKSEKPYHWLGWDQIYPFKELQIPQCTWLGEEDTHVIHVHDSKTKANSAALMCLIFAFMVCLKLQSLKGLSGGCKVWIWIRKQMLDSFSKTFKAARRCIQPFKPKGTSRTHTATGPRLRSEWWMCWPTTVLNQHCFFFLLLLLFLLAHSNLFDLQIWVVHIIIWMVNSKSW